MITVTAIPFLPRKRGRIEAGEALVLRIICEVTGG
jgi:hypothetical protein